MPTLGRSSLQKTLDSLGDLPYIVEQDPQRTSAGNTRNRAIQKVTTDWVGFCDDDDILTEDYYDRFKEERKAHPEADVIIFRMQHSLMGLVPRVPEIRLGNVGISFCLKTKWAKRIPFIEEDPKNVIHEDYQLLRDLQDAGADIHFSKHLTYLVGKKT